MAGFGTIELSILGGLCLVVVTVATIVVMGVLVVMRERRSR